MFSPKSSFIKSKRHAAGVLCKSLKSQGYHYENGKNLIKLFQTVEDIINTFVVVVASQNETSSG